MNMNERVLPKGYWSSLLAPFNNTGKKQHAFRTPRERLLEVRIRAHTLMNKATEKKVQKITDEIHSLVVAKKSNDEKNNI